MPRILTSVLVVALSFAAGGCGGDGKLRTQGRLLKGGQSFAPGDGEYIQITFVPILPNNKLVGDYYYADVDQATGTFMPAGKDRKGMPPGKYRVAVELMKKKKDQFGGKFSTEKSPYVFDVDAATAEIVIDLDKPPTG